MKLLISGYWGWQHMEPVFASALESLGHSVLRFSFKEFFHGRLGHYQNAVPVPGPALLKLNRKLIDATKAGNPDVVLIWNGTHVLPSTVRRIGAMGCKVVSYSNDDPFGHLVHGRNPWHHRYLWHWYLKSLSAFDLNFVYRPVNVQEARSHGARNVQVLMPYFIPGMDEPACLDDDEQKRFGCDVVFIGHYEPDRREEHLRALVAAGVKVKLYGGGYWTRTVLGDDLADYFGDISPVYGKEYSKALCGGRICLAFLSKMNRDGYTRRCLEIPACGRLLMCERTPEIQKMFAEGEEAVFFSSQEELVEKVLELLKKPDVIERIAAAGRKRVWADGHDVFSRAREFMEITDRY